MAKIDNADLDGESNEAQDVLDSEAETAQEPEKLPMTESDINSGSTEGDADGDQAEVPEIAADGPSQHETSDAAETVSTETSLPKPKPKRKVRPKTLEKSEDSSSENNEEVAGEVQSLSDEQQNHQDQSSDQVVAENQQPLAKTAFNHPGYQLPWWKRIFGQQIMAQKMTAPDPAPVTNNTYTTNDVDLVSTGATTEELTGNLQTMEQELASISAAIIEDRAKSEAMQNKLLEAQDSMEQLETWIGAQSSSFFWKVKARMKTNLKAAEADLLHFEEQVRNLAMPDEGTLEKIRSSFHKGLGVTAFSSFLPLALLFFIPWAARNDLPALIANAVQQGWLIPAVLIFIAIYVGVVGLIQRGLRLQKKKTPWNQYVKQIVIFALIIALVLLFVWFPDFMLNVVTPAIESIRNIATAIILIGLFFALVGLLLTYYSKWSQFRREVVEQYTNLENVVQGYVKTRQELARLEGVYQQLTEWLELIAHTLYRPWHANPNWKTNDEVKASTESMPRALRVAQAIESDPADTAKLENLIASHLLVQGWRNQAFLESLEEVSRLRGLTGDALSARQLERDLPHQPNNTRKLALEEFRKAAQNQKQQLSTDFLEEVAKIRLGFLAKRTQGFALSEAQPRVQHVVEDPLRSLLGNGIEDASSIITSTWDSFLSSNLGLEEPIQPPLSSLSFTDEGIMQKVTEPFTFVIAPEKVAIKLETMVESSVTLESVEVDSENPRAEIVVRIDVTRPIGFGNVNMIAKGSSMLANPAPSPHDTSTDQDL